MYCREQFLKSPAPPPSLSNDSDDNDDYPRKKGKHRHRRRSKRISKAVHEDINHWITDDDSDDPEKEFTSSSMSELGVLESEVKLQVMKEIFDAQTDEVKSIIIGLFNLELKRRKVNRMNKLTKLPTLNLRKRMKKKLSSRLEKKPGLYEDNDPIKVSVMFRNYAKIIRRPRRKKKSSGRKKVKFPRRKRSVFAKNGNRQFQKRVFRAQKFFQKGVFLAGGRLLEEVCQAVKDSSRTATSFCNNNVHALSKVHRKQIALYEKIEDDLHRLDTIRLERADAAEQRQIKQMEKLELRKMLKNRIELRAAAKLQKDERRKERRMARKERALVRKVRRDQARAELLKYSLSLRTSENINCKG